MNDDDTSHILILHNDNTKEIIVFLLPKKNVYLKNVFRHNNFAYNNF